MKKGFEWSVNLLVAVILAVVAAGIFWSALSGKPSPAKAETVKLNEGCNNDGDCINNLDGSKCLTIYPGDFVPFCGCLTSNDCLNKRSGNCGSNNKCV